MARLKYLFIFDTNFFRSLIHLKSLVILERIQEIFNFYNEIDYIATTDIIRELSRFRKENKYLVNHIKFIQETTRKGDIKKLKKINIKSRLYYLNKNEHIDYIFIQTAIDSIESSEYVCVVTDDEGIHDFIEFIIDKENIGVTWNHGFLKFLAGYASEGFETDEILTTANKQKQYINKFRKERERRNIQDFSDKFLKDLKLI